MHPSREQELTSRALGDLFSKAGCAKVRLRRILACWARGARVIIFRRVLTERQERALVTGCGPRFGEADCSTSGFRARGALRRIGAVDSCVLEGSLRTVEACVVIMAEGRSLAPVLAGSAPDQRLRHARRD